MKLSLHFSKRSLKETIVGDGKPLHSQPIPPYLQCERRGQDDHQANALFSTGIANYPSLSPLFGEGNGNPLQYSCLENPMDGGAWWATVHGVVKSQTRLSDFFFTFRFHSLEKEMATHSSVLAWRIPGMGSVVGCRLWGHTELDMTEATWQQQQQHTTEINPITSLLNPRFISIQ